MWRVRSPKQRLQKGQPGRHRKQALRDARAARVRCPRTQAMNLDAVRRLLRPMSDDEFAALLREHVLDGGPEGP